MGLGAWRGLRSALYLPTVAWTGLDQPVCTLHQRKPQGLP